MNPMQPLLRLLCALSLVLLTQACTKEDLAACKSRLTIRFQHGNDGVPTDLFPDEVRAISLFVFDANGMFVGEQTTLPAPGNCHSLTLTLPEGVYDFIAWEGIRNNYLLTPLTVGVTRLDEAILRIKQDAEGNLERHNEPIYYGAAFGFLKTDEKQNHIVEMVRKTRFIRLTVNGLPYSTPATRAPEQEEEFISYITSPDGASNYDNSLAGNKELIHIPHHDPAHNRMVSDFVIMYYPDLWSSRLVLEFCPDGSNSANKQVLVDENLRELLQQNPNVDVTVDTEFDIDITFNDLTAGDVTIRVNGWKVSEDGGIVG